MGAGISVDPERMALWSRWRFARPIRSDNIYYVNLRKWGMGRYFLAFIVMLDPIGLSWLNA